MSDVRFTSQSSTAEDLLQTQSVGLLNFSDYSKRHADALEQTAKDGSASQTPSKVVSRDVIPSERSATPPTQVKKKRKTGRGKLSFAVDDENDEAGQLAPCAKSQRKGKNTKTTKPVDDEIDEKLDTPGLIKSRLGPNTSITNAPKILTKSALLKEAQAREELRKEFLVMQEAVKASDITIPFVFFDGTHVPGGSCRVKKGNYIWVFLDKCRKLGAELAVGGSGEAKNRREWARVGVDDLMLVRGEIIIPHHYEFYYFVVNKTVGYDGQPIFSYSTEPPKEEGRRADEDEGVAEAYNPLSRPGDGGPRSVEPPLTSLEGANDDPNVTKVVNRQWYERNKHIFPASTWEEFDPKKDYTRSLRKDAQGNTFFFSR